MPLLFRPKYWLIGGLFVILTSILLINQLQSQKLRPVIIDADPRVLYQVVAGQIEAFQKHDYPSAYGFAARGIRDKFPLEQFSDMVRNSYPQLTEGGRLNFATARFVAADRASLLIYLINGDRVIPAIYSFSKEREGWKIEGVELIRSVFPNGNSAETQT